MLLQVSPVTDRRPFGHLRDPLFLCCFAVWLVLRSAKATSAPPVWITSYLNDLICIPFWVPVFTAALTACRVRSAEIRPSSVEIVFALVTFAVIFEFVLPGTPRFRGKAISDPNDIVCYSAGAFAANEYWRCRYAAKADSTSEGRSAKQRF